MKTSILALIAIMTVAVASAQKTTRVGLHAATPQAESPAATTAADVDTVVGIAPHTIDINGYDKPLRSRRETFFVTNNSDRPTMAISFTIDYFDSQKRQLHQRKVNLPLEIPAGETRQASLKTWDPQLSFYYTRSAVPARASQATPYDVKIAVDTIFYSR